MNYVKVELLRDLYYGQYHDYEKGDIVELPATEAQYLINKGFAKQV